MSGEQVLDLSDFQRGQASQDVAEIFLRVEAASPATDQDGIDHRTAPPGLGVADEEPPFAAHRRGPDIVLHQGMPTSGLCRAISPPIDSELESGALIVAEAA